NVPGQDPMDFTGTNATAQTATATTADTVTGQTQEAQAQTAAQVDPRQAVGYDPALTQQNIAQNGQMTAQQGTLSDGAIQDPNEVPQIDIDAHAKGETELGKALLEHAEQDLNDV